MNTIRLALRMLARDWRAGELSVLIAALVLGLINTFIRPLLVLLTLPATVLTLGLFIFVINGLLFWFVGSFIEGFHVAGPVQRFDLRLHLAPYRSGPTCPPGLAAGKLIERMWIFVKRLDDAGQSS